MDLEEKLKRCREIDFLAPLGEESLRRLLGEAREVVLEAGEVLCHEGDAGQAMYVVLAGELLVYKAEAPIAQSGPGTYVGEMALVESRVRSASVKAIQSATLLELTEDHFRGFVVPNADALLAIMRTLSLRSRNDLATLDSSFKRLKEYSEEIERANQNLQEARQQLMRTNRELERLSTLDTLTGLANRRRFDVSLRSEWRRAARDNHPLSLILCDIDCFKGYNDTYGHPAGDEVLVRVADAIRDSLRRPADLAARYGGEEFIVILANTDSAGAVALAEKIREGVEAMRIRHEASTVSEWVTVSFGVATIVPDPDREPQELIDRADRALYTAKESGRNRVCSDGPRPVSREA